jgi:hypothetical protein
MKTNPKGRVDVLALAVAERLTHDRLEPRIGNAPVWDALKPLAEQGIRAGMKALGIPRKNLLASDFGRALESAFDRTRLSGGAF